ncbi:hypothetical protein CIRG_04876 [Coccidioides immitis RMSCC 2394]|uniref:Uncharacterized protein n=1 Tax=Coccidioides immitis RMSCC 2394 TaxID=404692 RepID=A0A0J6YBS5_COCIT|nr:hypothetical protein CIRG_04876 [Coccidioides immitis RMSCC 2394]
MCPAGSFAGITPPPRRHTLPAAGCPASKSPNASHPPNPPLLRFHRPVQRSQQFQRKRSTPIQAMELRRHNFPNHQAYQQTYHLHRCSRTQGARIHRHNPFLPLDPTQLPTRRSLPYPPMNFSPASASPNQESRKPHPTALALMRTRQMPILCFTAGLECARGRRRNWRCRQGTIGRELGCMMGRGWIGRKREGRWRNWKGKESE